MGYFPPRGTRRRAILEALSHSSAPSTLELNRRLGDGSGSATLSEDVRNLIGRDLVAARKVRGKFADIRITAEGARLLARHQEVWRT